MKFKLTKKEILTIPNLLTLIRIILIPVIVILYHNVNYQAAAIVLLISALTDVADGFVARKFNMVSNLGKFLDPLADKLTQAAVVLALALTEHFDYVMYLLIFLVIKEIVMAVAAFLGVKFSGKVQGAEWHGKLAAFLLYIILAVHMYWDISLNIFVSWYLLLFVGCVMAFSMITYVLKNVLVILKARKK